MKKLDVFSLAETVAQASVSGEITRELLRDGNDLYEPLQQIGKLKRFSPCGAIDVGCIKDGRFLVEQL